MINELDMKSLKQIDIKSVAEVQSPTKLKLMGSEKRNVSGSRRSIPQAAAAQEDLKSKVSRMMSNHS